MKNISGKGEFPEEISQEDLPAEKDESFEEKESSVVESATHASDDENADADEETQSDQDKNTGDNGGGDDGQETGDELDVLWGDVTSAIGAIRKGTAMLYRAVQAAHDKTQEDAAALANQVEVEAEAALAAGVDPRRVRRGREVRELAERSFVAELACLIQEHEAIARSLVADASILTTSLPASLEKLEAGGMTIRQLQDILDQTTCLPNEIIPEFERVALERASTQTSTRFRRTVRVLRERLHPESIQIRKRAAITNRRMDCAPTQDGMSWLSFYIASEYATGITERLHAHAIELGLYEDESRTKAQLEADIAVDLLLNGTTAPSEETILTATANSVATVTSTDTATSSTDTVTGTAAGIAGYGVRAVVYVTVPVLSLLGHSDESAELEGVGPIDIDTARTLCAGATSFYRILTHPVTGAYLSVGRVCFLKGVFGVMVSRFLRPASGRRR